MPKFKQSEGFRMPGAPFMKKPTKTVVSEKKIETSLANREKGFQGIEVTYSDGSKSKSLVKTVKNKKDKKDQTAPEYRSNIDEID